jgi:hypothetical protein
MRSFNEVGTEWPAVGAVWILAECLATHKQAVGIQQIAARAKASPSYDGLLSNEPLPRKLNVRQLRDVPSAANRFNEQDAGGEAAGEKIYGGDFVG